MSRATEILREYLERRRAEPGIGSPDALREENLRRLLRHTSAARQPSEQLEPRLLQAMLREGQRAARRRGRPWRLFSRPAWVVLAPAAALAAAGALVAWNARSSGHSGDVAIVTPVPADTSRHDWKLSPPRKARRPIGLVIMGELQRRNPGDERWQPVDSGTTVFLDDSVRTGPEATGSIVFMDGSVSRLLPGSAVRYTGSPRGDVKRPLLVILSRGEVWHTVEKGGPAFTVQTATAQAIVHGTEFGVAFDPGVKKTTLRVKSGNVELRAARALAMVAAGMQSVVLPGHGPGLPAPITPLVRTASGKHGPRGGIHFIAPPGRPKAEPAGASSDKNPEQPASPGPPAPAPAEPSAAPPGVPGSSPSSDAEGTDVQRPFSTSR